MLFEKDSANNIKWCLSLADVPVTLKADLCGLISFTGSMTGLLQQMAGDRPLIIKLLKQHIRPCHYLEALILECVNNAAITERIIQMTVDNNIWLYARSYFSPYAMAYFGEALTNLGNNSLGVSLINSHPNMVRSNFEYGMLDKNIVRRSCFKLNNQVLFSLEEAFLPPLLAVRT